MTWLTLVCGLTLTLTLGATIGAALGLVGLIGLMGFMFAALWSAWRAKDGELGGEARAVLAALIGYLVCQMFAGYSNSWFLFALCGFATCCDAWQHRMPEETV